MAGKKKVFFDTHFHAMSIDHPNFIAFLHELESNFSEEVVSGMFSPNYLLSSKGSSAFLTRLQNMLAVIDRPIGQIFALMEDDLSSRFEVPAAFSLLGKPNKREHEPFISEGLLHFRSLQFDSIGMCPMIMDFTQRQEIRHGVYSHRHTEDRLLDYIEDTLEGIRWYARSRPKGLFTFFPFLGVNPSVHSRQFTQDLLQTYLRVEESQRVFSRQDVFSSDRFCYGIKFYPPLDFDPWPVDDPQALEHVSWIYDFCQSNRIPITTHCDDQGFRTIPNKRAWEFSSPRRWAEVLKQFPLLIIDFAHLGKQYRPVANVANMNLKVTSKLLGPSSTGWSQTILELIGEYEHVYTDFSFSGCQPHFYKQLHDSLSGYEKQQRKKICSRIMFGSDFFVNLSKVDSYAHFFSLFEDSPFDEEFVQSVCSSNPLRWLHLGDE